MKNKISIILLILLFLISTIGFPVVINCCSVNENVQREVKEISSKNLNPKAETFNISFIKEDCRKTEFIDKSIFGQFLESDTQNQDLNKGESALINYKISQNNYTLSNSVRYYNGTLPPSIKNNHIYLNNSILII
jgi:hypothetical protein